MCKKLFLFSCLVFAGASHLIAAPTLSDYAGDYRIIVYEYPSRLIKALWNPETQTVRHTWDASGAIAPNEQLVDVYYSHEPEFSSFEGSIAANGTVTLPGETTTATATANGRLIVDGYEEETVLFPSPGLGMLLSANQETDLIELIFLVKQTGATMTPAELAGTWQIVSFNAASSLLETFWDGQNNRTGTDSQDNAREGEELVDVRLTEEPSIIAGSLVMTAGGQVSGAVNGTFAIGAGNAVTFTDDGEDIVLHPSPDRNVLTGLIDGGTTQDIVMAVRKGPNPSVADLAGTWRWFSLTVPRTVKETWRNVLTDQRRTGADSTEYAGENERLVDVADGPYYSESGTATLTAAGEILNEDDETFSINANGEVLLNLAGGTDTLFVSAARDFMVGVNERDDYQELLIVVREPRLGGTINGNTVSINWGGTSTGMLQKSPNLIDWDDVGLIGANGSVNEPFNSTGSFYYRIIPTN